MRKQIKCSGIALASWLMLAMAGGAAVQAAPEAKVASRQGALAGYANGAQIRLRWELVRTVFTPEAPGGGTQARLILTNLSQQPLPAQGWALYFNVMDGVAAGPLEGHLLLEQVAGNLFRIRPAPGFAGVPAGQTLNIAY